MFKKPLINNQIRAAEVRMIDESGKQLGIMKIDEALQLAEERHLDLIQITEKVVPPVCKIIDYGKYLYWQEKKARESKKQKGGETKGIRLSFGISLNDLQTKAKLAKKFLENKNRVKIAMILKGREKAHLNVAKEKIGNFLKIISETTPIKIDQELKKEFRGFTMIITKQ